MVAISTWDDPPPWGSRDDGAGLQKGLRRVCTARSSLKVVDDDGQRAEVLRSRLERRGQAHDPGPVAGIEGRLSPPPTAAHNALESAKTGIHLSG